MIRIDFFRKIWLYYSLAYPDCNRRDHSYYLPNKFDV